MRNRARLDITGERYGRLIAIAYAGLNKRRQSVWRFRCDCGSEKDIVMVDVRRGNTLSCGCGCRQPVHGLGNHPVYMVWHGMIRRCLNPEDPAYKNYGGRGITVCNRWRDIRNFYADMGDPPEGLTLDRINNNGNYEPGNCRWATWSEQMRNRRPIVRLRNPSNEQFVPFSTL